MENRTDICVIMLKLCEYVRNEWWKPLFDCGPPTKKMTFIWDGRNPLSVNGSYSQGTWHAHHVKWTSSLSLTEWTNSGKFICWNDDTYWNWSESCSIVHNGVAHCSCRIDCNIRHCFCLYFVQTNKPMWHLTHDGFAVMSLEKDIVRILYQWI